MATPDERGIQQNRNNKSIAGTGVDMTIANHAPSSHQPYSYYEHLFNYNIWNKPFSEEGEAFDDKHFFMHTSSHTRKAIDRLFKSNVSRFTLGITPVGLAKVWFDWALHLSSSPGKQIELAESAVENFLALWRQLAFSTFPMNNFGVVDQGEIEDPRFTDDAWQYWPFNITYRSFLLYEKWWLHATTDIDGFAHNSERVVSFTARQVLDMWAPCNWPQLNPQVMKVSFQKSGMNFLEGGKNFIEDVSRSTYGEKPIGCENYVVGEHVATTPGKVVYRNHLIELIQYSPSTGTVYAEPVVIIPAWIMKYYILDLSQRNSLVKYLVDQGHTVFMVSWRNPCSSDRDLGMHDYRETGVLAAFNAVNSIIPHQKIHAVGYCLGGTLLTITAAAMARENDDRLASLTLLATQVDFTEAGELMLFISESEIAYLESMMWDSGYLDGYQMAGAFQILRSNDLLWSRVLQTYLLGERQGMNDLMAWNADLTRMPYTMHSEYLRHLFLNNELASGRYLVNGRPAVINDIRAPIAAIGTKKDHVAPWRSVYKIHLLADTDEVTFILVSGGHNAGIVSEPGHAHRSYQIRTQKEKDTYIDADTWVKQTAQEKGSWWPAWQHWIVQRSSADKIAFPCMGNPQAGYEPLIDAPGSYALQR